MALHWATKRKTVYTITAVFILVLPISIFWAIRAYDPATCFDGEQNQEEEGVDCGGPCDLFCAQGNDDLVVLWDRSIYLGGGEYNAVASVENNLNEAGIQKVQYLFTFYDQNGDLITKKIGSTFVNPGERFVIFEPRIKMGYRVPKTTFLKFQKEMEWVRTTEEPPKIIVEERKMSDLDTRPRLEATLRNPLLVKIENIEVVAVVYGTDGNAIGVSGTFIETFPRTSTRKAYFTWPRPFDGEVSRVDIVPRVSVFRWEKPLK